MKAERSWWNWQTRKTKDLVGDHAGSSPVDRTKNTLHSWGVFFLQQDLRLAEDESAKKTARGCNFMSYYVFLPVVF